MKIIVGLGNPGTKYRYTRHNLGFLVVDALAERFQTAFDREKHQGLIAESAYARERLLLVKPQTFMNCSGDCVAQVARNKIQDLDSLLVVVDDVNLALGTLRFRAGGSAGGHNGLKSIIERLGSNTFHRLRLGVGDDRKGAGLADHVLAKFLPDEQPAVHDMIHRATAAVVYWIERGMEQAMNEFN